VKELNVLLVDDEEELVMTLAERLNLRGIHADWATTADEALNKLDRSHYDIALLDVKIPKMNGIELKKRMEEKSMGMKFIFLTGHGSEADFKAGSIEAGSEYYLVKPVDIGHLIAKMFEIVGKQGDSPWD
jgi:DNA-binding response OmpR family regulator